MIQNLDERIWSVFEQENIVGNDLVDALNHGMLVSNLAGLLAAEHGCNEEFCTEIMRAGLVHDIGKLQLGRFLYGRNDGGLEIEELKYVRMHPTLGHERLVRIGGFSDLVLEAVYHHHENFDGTGYPRNLRGEKIPLAARILRICDVYAAMISERPYRAAFDSDAAVEMMIDEVHHFDMKMFLAFLKIVHSEQIEEIWQFAECANKKIRDRGNNKEDYDVQLNSKQLAAQIAQLRQQSQNDRSKQKSEPLMAILECV